MSRVVHFEFHVENPQKVISFYQNAFGWQFQKWEGPMDYWLITTGEADTPGIDGGLAKSSEQFKGTLNTVQVANLDQAIEKVKRNGGTIAMEKQAIPGVGWWACFIDPEGTLLGIMQSDPSAEM